ncbi:hypothetical protein ENKNEFLB_02540 [Nocardioides aquaticus]|uniref:Methyltransferase domain-containing protein n=1 Tax=Nocardioides aquaticus TaxID=160826 RepID=A0ABX8EIQ3_9ACTN|nr:DUF480 domain-containing protein [Nocardioides aquaticus]QVT80149.1 hypothetical protein ENKNEFLB_02540 [Nocardioides aquaticus]
MTLPRLDDQEQRVLGALLEKQRTVPASYPLSGQALRSACNQTSSREPVVDYDDATVEQVARRLKDHELVRIVWSEKGRRTLRYHQRLTEALDLGDDEAAVVTLLLLRGAQAPGELRTRSERLHAFADRRDVEEVLARLASRDEPVVRELERRPGQRERRWVHLLGPVDDGAGGGVGAGAGGAGAGAVAEVALPEGGPEARDARVRTSYDAVAAAYADALTDELDGLVLERWLLDRVAAHAVADGGPVVEVGCGPGHVTAYLAAAGAQAHGLDLSPGMVDQARARFPDAEFQVGDLRRLVRPRDHDGWAAVLAWYSLVHSVPAELPEAFAALVRPLRPGGLLVVALHAGSGLEHAGTWFDADVDLDFVRHDPASVAALLADAGLVDVEWYHRGPVTARGEQRERVYLLARRDDAPGQPR